MSAPHRATRRLVRVVVSMALLAFPGRFRRGFGGPMRDALDERLRSASQRSRWAVLRAGARTVIDVVRAGLAERVSPVWPPDEDVADDARAGAKATLRDWFDGAGQDVRIAARGLARRPAFTVVAVVTLALGIGANTAIFSVVNGVLLRPLPYPEPERLAMLWSHDVATPEQRGWMSQQDLDDLRASPGLAAAEGYNTGSFTVAGEGGPVRVPGGRVSGGLLEVFGLTPVAGRDLRHEENSPDAPRVVLIGHGMWQERFGADPGVVGRSMELSERSYEIVGVAPSGFDFPNGAELWVTQRFSEDGCPRGCSIYQAVARVASGVGVDAADADVARIGAALRADYPDSNYEKGFRLEPLLDYTVGDVRAGLWIVLGAVGVVLLIACANVANLLLVRATTRRGEVAVRAALGASRLRLFREVLLESAWLAAVGTALGVALAAFGVSLLRQLSAGTIPRMEDVAVDPSVLLFAAALCGVVTLLFGLSPAAYLARTSVMDALGSSGRGARAPGARGRSALLAAEVGLSLVLLVAAGLIARSLVGLHRVDLGFDQREVLRFGLSLPSARYPDLAAISSFYRRLEERVGSLPGVAAVGSSFGGPLRGGSLWGTVLVDGRPDPSPAEETVANVRAVTPGYLETLGYRMIRGRSFTREDDTGLPVAVVNETFVRENFPGEDPLGRRIRVTVNMGFGSPTWEIVGVVQDVRSGPRDVPGSEVLVSQAQFGPGSLTVNVRGVAGVAGLLAPIRETVAELDPNLPLSGVETIADAVARDTAPTRFYLVTVGLFAFLAVLLAGVGLYGVVAYLVSRRTREIGVRLALGARRPVIVSMVLRQGVAPTAWGLAAGLAVAIPGTALLEGILFQVERTDALVFTGVPVLVAAVAVVATLLPARRAARVDPVVALRDE